MWAFDDKINKKVVFIPHNGCNYDVHFIVSYLVEKTEYPELMCNRGKILQMYIKACESKFIDSSCFLSMPLSKFSDTFNLLDVVKTRFCIVSIHQTITGRLACYNVCIITNQMFLKNPLILNSSIV